MKREILLYGDSQNNADMLYFSGISIPDAFFAFTLDNQQCALLSPLEIGRARKSSKFKKLYDMFAIFDELPDGQPRDEISALEFILLKNKKKNFVVPQNFPAFALDRLREDGFNIQICEGEIFESRAVKSKFELEQIRKANSVAEAAFEYSQEILRNSIIERGMLYWRNEALTSEILRAEIEKLAISLDADARNTIVAAGNQACNPHEVGHGHIAANTLIVMDIFPRLRSSGYYGDMTRTFLKGVPSDAQFRLVETVLQAQECAISKIKAGVKGSAIHNIVCEIFDANDYFTTCKKGTWSGFFHSTGHGLGLDVHESPSLGRRDCVLRAGNVVTVEPGLYYVGLGGCRIEDNVVVKKGGCELLSNYHYGWIIE